MPDVLLREGLKRDNAEHIIPQYNAFFEMYANANVKTFIYLFNFYYRYADVQFSKSPEKYVKYRPQDVSAMLSNLFDDRV